MPNKEQRKDKVLTIVVDEYIKTGIPVGSNTVLTALDVEVSSATVRNTMAQLEKEGYLEQPHTSAGRVPTCIGYQYYIKHLMVKEQLTQDERSLIDTLLEGSEVQNAQSIVDTAANILSDLTEMTVVSKSNAPIFSVITRVEVIPAGKRLYALLVITSAGNVENKVCRMEFDVTTEQLEFFERFINENLKGLNIENLTESMVAGLVVAMGSYMMSLSPLLNTVYELGKEIKNQDISLTNEQKLLTTNDIDTREFVDLVTKKNELDKLLSGAFDDISVVFGEEEGSFAVTNSSMIVSQLSVKGEKAGTLGVIGPARVDYARIIPHIKYITDKVATMLENVLEEEIEDE